MATQRASSNIDIGAALQRFGDQFRGLNPNDPSIWPPVPRYALCVLVTAMVLVALWFVWLTNSNDELEAERAKEVALRADYQKKVGQAANLEFDAARTVAGHHGSRQHSEQGADAEGYGGDP